MSLALFDFDGTITTEDTFTRFMFYATPTWRLWLGIFLIWPVILLYKLRVLPAAKTRPVLSKVAFWGRAEPKVRALAAQFAKEYLPTVLRQEAMQRIKWHQQRGDKVVVVSATLDIYLSFWCKQHGVSLVCSELECKNNRLTGNYIYGDCHGQNKVDFLKKNIDLSTFNDVFAYGDTHEDLAMLAVANKRYYRWKNVA